MKTSGFPTEGWKTTSAIRVYESLFGYLAAVAYAVPLIALAPFFWAPPLWILALIAPVRGTRGTGDRKTAI